MTEEIDFSKPEFTESGRTTEAGGASEQDAQQGPGFMGGLWEMISGNERNAALPEDVQGLGNFANSPELSPFQSELSIADQIKTSASFLASSDPRVRKDAILSVLPESTFDEFGDENDPTTVVTTPKGKRYVLNAPGLDTNDILTSVTQMLSFAPQQRILGLAKSLAGKMGAAAAGSGATEYGLQKGARALAGSDVPVSGGDVALAGATGPAAEVISPATKSMAAYRAAKSGKTIQEEIVGLKDAVQAQAETGIDLFKGQITRATKDLDWQSYLPQLPASAKAAARELSKQNAQAQAAVTDFINYIAPAEAVIRGPKGIKDSAQLARDKAIDIRREKTSPLYNQAFEYDNPVINIKPVIQLIDGKLSRMSPKSSTAKQLQNIKEQIQTSVVRDKGLTGQPRLQPLHNTKIDIDETIENLSSKNSIGRTTKKEVLDVQLALKELLERSSHTYKLASENFAAKSGPVDLTELYVGGLADIDPSKLKLVAGKIFDPAETNPEVIKNVKKQITSVPGGQDAWDDIIRVEMERRLGNATMSLSEEGLSTQNVPGQLYRSLFGNVKNKRVLEAGMSESQRERMKFLEVALKRASMGRQTGSQTGSRQEMMKEVGRGASGWVRNLFRDPAGTAASIGEEGAVNQRLKLMGDAFFDPEWTPELDKIIKMSNKNGGRDAAMLRLLGDVTQAQQLNPVAQQYNLQQEQR